MFEPINYPYIPNHIGYVPQLALLSFGVSVFVAGLSAICAGRTSNINSRLEADQRSPALAVSPSGG